MAPPPAPTIVDPLAAQAALLGRAAAFLGKSLGRRPCGDIALRCRVAGNSLRELDLFLNDLVGAVRSRDRRPRRLSSAAEAYRRISAALPLDPAHHAGLRAIRAHQNRLAFAPLAVLAGEDAAWLAGTVRDGCTLYRRAAEAVLAASAFRPPSVRPEPRRRAALPGR